MKDQNAGPTRKDKDDPFLIGSGIKFAGNVDTNRTSVVQTGAGSYIAGDVYSGGGEFVGRDQLDLSDEGPEPLRALFLRCTEAIDALSEARQFDKADLHAELQEVQGEVFKGEAADADLLMRQIRIIGRIEQPLAIGLVTGLATPETGAAPNVRVLAEKLREMFAAGA